MTAVQSLEKGGGPASNPWKPYPAYRASGVEWLGDLPSSWDVKRLKRTTRLTDRKVEADEEHPVPYIGLENIESWTGRIVGLDADTIPTGTANAFMAKNTLFGKLRPYLAKACNPDFEGLCSTELLVLEGIEFDRRALLYTLLSNGFVELVDSSTYGSKMPRANWDFIGNCIVPVPSIAEQRAFADFLDRETGKIDRLVAKKRELIEKLKEERAALISRAVTRGLNPEAKLKSSGVEWLGDVPEGWTVSKVRFEARLVSKGTTPSTVGRELVDEGIRYIKAENLQDNRVSETPEFFIDADTDQLLSRSRLSASDVLVVIAGATTGKVAVLAPALLPANTNQAVCFVRLKNTGYSGLLAHWISTKFIQDRVWTAAVQSAQPNLAMEDIRAFPCLVPPPDEQRAIADFLDRETGKIDRLAAKVEEAIGRLQEYRAALITAAVTGKIDVREVAA